MSASAAGFAAMLREHDVYSRFPSEHRQAGSVPIDFVRLTQVDFEADDPPSEDFVLAIPLGPTDAVLEVDYGEGWRTLQNASLATYLNPAPAGAGYRQTGAADLVFVVAPLDPIATRLGFDGGASLREALRPLHENFGRDVSHRAQALAMWDAAASHGPFASLAVDHGLLALVANMLEQARPEARSVAAPPPRLDDARLQRVIDYVEATLGDPVRLDDLAGIACFSTFHFSRAFRDAVGMPPQRYVTSRRVERAKRLLRGPLPLAEIAFACGFASQSHFGQVFRAHTGMTPGEWRAGL